MSADVWIVRPACSYCGRGDDAAASLNITYNLSEMLWAAGFTGWQNIVGMPARQAGIHILTILDKMARDPERYRAMNPENGWGDYDSCVQGRMRAWALECLKAGSKDVIGGWL